PAETLKLMLQALLADRFKLVVHKDTKPVTGFVLSLGKSKPKLKEAEGSGETGCKPQPQAPPPPIPGIPTIPMTVFACHNITIEAFAAALRGMAPAYINNAVVDMTGLKGSWDFDLRFSNRALLQLTGAEGVTLIDAVDKQLGL